MGCSSSKPMAPTKAKEAPQPPPVETAASSPPTQPVQPPPLPFKRTSPPAESPPPVPPQDTKPTQPLSTTTEEEETPTPAEEPPANEIPPEVEQAQEGETQTEEPIVNEEKVTEPQIAAAAAAVVVEEEQPVQQQEEEQPAVVVAVVEEQETVAVGEAAQVETANIVAVLPGIAEEGDMTMGDKLRRENAVIYPSSSAALASKGLQKYASDLEKRGIVSYKDLSTFEEDLNDPFWSKMPPYPDRKKFKALQEEARIAFGIDDGTLASSEDAPSPSTPHHVHNETVIEGAEDDEPEYVPVREKTLEPCDAYDVDVYAKEFATCTCGHAKLQHKQFSLDQQAKQPSFVNRQQSARVQDPPSTPTQEGKPCGNYRLDLAASKPVCVTCGFAKLEHQQGSSLTSNGNTEPSPGSNRFKDMNKGSFKKTSTAQ